MIVILRPEETPRDLMDAVQASASIERRRPAQARRRKVLRTYGIGAQILRDLGVTPHARAVGAEADARPVRLRSRSRGVRAIGAGTELAGSRRDHRDWRPLLSAVALARAQRLSPLRRSRFAARFNDFIVERC